MQSLPAAIHMLRPILNTTASFDAKELGINFIDADHFCTENVVVPVLADKLSGRFEDVSFVVSSVHKQTAQFFLKKLYLSSAAHKLVQTRKLRRFYMTNLDIYKDISARTGGAVMIGVVGPVRTGKSTFIKRFMETLVIPNIEDEYARERARDELPQSGSGRTIMTAEPKFVPEDAVRIRLSDDTTCMVRLVDCVGYMVQGLPDDSRTAAKGLSQRRGLITR